MPQLLIRADAETAEAFKALARAEGLTFGALLARLLSGAISPEPEASRLEALEAAQKAQEARLAALEARALAPDPAGPAKPQSGAELPEWVPRTGAELVGLFKIMNPRDQEDFLSWMAGAGIRGLPVPVMKRIRDFASRADLESDDYVDDGAGGFVSRYLREEMQEMRGHQRREGEAEGLPAWVPSTGPELHDLLSREGIAHGTLAARLGVSRPRVTALCRLEVLSPEMRGRLAEAIRAPE